MRRVNPYPMHERFTKLAAQSSDPERVLSRLQQLAAAAPNTLNTPDLADLLIPLVLNSEVLTHWLCRHPLALDDLHDLDALFVPTTLTLLTHWWSDPPPHNEDSLLRALRTLRYRAYLRIAIRDTALHAPVTEICQELSTVAEFILERALEVSHAALSTRFGPPIDSNGQIIPFVIMGMGKLGGHELNYSSDVDLIYAYATDDGAAGRLSPHEYFSRLAKKLSHSVSAVTADGFAFRVDLRLRPEGRSGPLCNSVSSMERYYEAWGRTWERLAWLRARPVAGDLALGHQILKRLRPWIYQRSVGATTIDAIRALKAKIFYQRRSEIARGHAVNLDLKLDSGGIRALEFFVHTIQLIRAGREPNLRDPATLGTLERLRAAGHLTSADRDHLLEAYILFRRVEHRIQMEHEQQTHRLPAGDDLERLAHRLGFENQTMFLTTLNAHRKHVADRFDELVGDAPSGTDPVRDDAQLLLSPQIDTDTLHRILSAHGASDLEQALHLLTVGGRHPNSPLSIRAPDRWANLGVDLIAEVLRSPSTERALTHLVAFLSQAVRRPTTLQAIADRPSRLRQLIRLFGTSDLLSETLLRSPSLLEVIYTTPTLSQLTPPAEVIADLNARIDDLESLIEAVSNFQKRRTFELGLLDLAGQLDPHQAGLALTELAEAILDVVFKRAQYELIQRYGSPRTATGDIAPCAIIGFGRLGGREMAYLSDLDVVFLYAEPGESDGPRPISHHEWFTRLARRIISLLGLPTRSGALYTVDTRLRPEGQHGTLVTRLANFEAYHHRSATWERLALIRARTIVGAPAFCRQVDQILQALSYPQNAPTNLWTDAAQMRARIEAEVAREGSHRYNPKSGRGGLVDIEFIAQTLQIAHGANRPALRTTHTLEALRALETEGLLPSAPGLIDAWFYLRRLSGRLRICRGHSVPELRADTITLDQVSRSLGYSVDPLDSAGIQPGARLLRDYRRITDRVRLDFDQIVCRIKEDA